MRRAAKRERTSRIHGSASNRSPSRAGRGGASTIAFGATDVTAPQAVVDARASPLAAPLPIDLGPASDAASDAASRPATRPA